MPITEGNKPRKKHNRAATHLPDEPCFNQSSLHDTHYFVHFIIHSVCCLSCFVIIAYGVMDAFTKYPLPTHCFFHSDHIGSFRTSQLFDT